MGKFDLVSFYDFELAELIDLLREVVMRIGGQKKVNKTNNKQTTARSGNIGGLFRVDSAQNAGQVIATPAAQSINNIGALLSAQEIDGVQAKHSAAVKRGSEMLDILDKLKIGLLSGRIAPNMLNQLKHLSVEQPGKLADERLEKIVQSIELRTKVELAKLAQQKIP